MFDLWFMSPRTSSTTSSISKTPSKKVSSKKTIKKSWSSTTISKKSISIKSVDILPIQLNTFPERLNTNGWQWRQLVIVESPAKAKTISKFLWSMYEVRASMWHVIELADKKMDELVAKQFVPEYTVAEGKEKVVKELKSLAKVASKVWIATDEDREWEAIGRHLMRLLWLEIEHTPRIVFHEITKQAISHAIEHPRIIDMNLVNAQQGRSVLDKLVWFTLSPLLWKKIKTWLSAWRVQSIAVKLIVEREREIESFQSDESWSAHAQLNIDKQSLIVDAHSFQWKPISMTNKSDFLSFCDMLGINISWFINHDDRQPITWLKSSSSKQKKTEWLYQRLSREMMLTHIQHKEWFKTPWAPFTTSTLQQTASRMFGRWVKQVMSVAQKLYENGHITYMRTDSTNLSVQALASAKQYVVDTYGLQYHTTRTYTSKSKNAQEAHEAIRPTNISMTPQSSGLSAQELRLYDLIRRRTLATQMSSAKVMNTTYTFELKESLRQAKGQVITFDWFLIIMPTSTEDVILPDIKLHTILHTDMIRGEQHFTKPPARYTEASLVKELEKKGIGRPSTYAPTISTVQDRWYVVKDDAKKLKPTDIAMVVTDYLMKHISDVMDYDFTAHLEQKLDHIAAGETQRQEMLMDFYRPFAKTVKIADGEEREYTKIGRACPKCSDGQLVMKFSKTSSFVWCNNYPECDYSEESEENKDILTPLKSQFEWTPCPAGGTIVVRLGRFWPFLSSSLYPQVKRIAPIPDPKKDRLEKEYGWSSCPECKEGILTIKKKRWKPRQWALPYFLACNRYPQCKHATSLNLTQHQKDEFETI